MAGLWKYTDRVTNIGDGVFLWRCGIDEEYERGKLKSGFKVCLLIDVFILGLGAVFTINSHEPGFFIVVGICAATFLLLSIVIFGLSALLVKSPGELYTMTDTFVQTGTGQTTTTFDYRKATEVVVTTRYIELKNPLKNMRVYAPPEDMSFVRNYILRRTGNADVMYE